jgi:hypothetical protein
MQKAIIVLVYFTLSMAVVTGGCIGFSAVNSCVRCLGNENTK